MDFVVRNNWHNEFPNRDLNWGRDTENSVRQLRTESHDPPSSRGKTMTGR